jgi:hypothetical protein
MMMESIDYENILQLLPARKRTWAAYAIESEEKNFVLEPIECWAVVEYVRECEAWNKALANYYIDRVPCIKQTVVRPLFLSDMHPRNCFEDDNLLGFTHDPRSDWTGEAGAYLAKRAKDRKELGHQQEERKKNFAVYAPAVWEEGTIPSYEVVDHGPNERSKHMQGQCESAPTRHEREQHPNFLGWALTLEAWWSENERKMWQNKAIEKRKAKPDVN